MILTVDIGNTNIKIGAWDNDKLSFVTKMQSNSSCTSDEYAIKLLDAFRLSDCNPSQFDGAILSSVVPQISSIMTDAIQRVIQTSQVFLVGPGLKTGLNIKIDNPATLGSDMVCAGVSAINKYQPPCIIISLGTATALFAINQKGEFIGGSVAPGMVISLDALANRTAQLPHISMSQPGPVIGTNTIDSMKSGSIYGTASMIDGMLDRMAEEMGEIPTFIACGGLAQIVSPYCKHSILCDDNLVLDGLRIIYQKNDK